MADKQRTNLAKQSEQTKSLTSDEAQLIGVAKILDILWENSHYSMGKRAADRLEKEMKYYFGENCFTDMWDFMLKDGVSKSGCHPESVKTLSELREAKDEQ